MEVSRYTCFVEGYPNQDDVLVYNTRTEAFFKINNELYRALLDINGNGATSEQYLQFQEPLHESGIIVSDNQEEEQLIDNFFHQLRVGDDYDMNVMFLTTYACNFSCIYCYQGPLQEKSMMTQETAKAAVKWICDQLEIKSYKKLSICFYGGEPLLNKDIMFYSIEKLFSFCKKRNIEFNLGMITNGSLLTVDIVKSLLKYNLNEIRISVDGNRECHNNRRPFKNGNPSFDVVMDNVKAVSSYIKPTIIGTYDQNTLDGVYGLIDYLQENDLLDKVAEVGFSPLIPRMGAKEQSGAVEMTDCTQIFDAQDLALETIKIKRALMDKGVPARAGLSINICPMIMKHQGAIIDPYGDIYSCTAFLGHNEYAIGDVSKSGYNNKSVEFQKLTPWKQCPADCTYLPMCQGGCRFLAYAENKDIASLCCKKGFYDITMPELMKFQYDCLSVQG